MNENLLKQGLHTWPKTLKFFFVGFLFLLTSGVSIGLVYLLTTTSYTVTGTIEHYNGSQVPSDDM